MAFCTAVHLSYLRCHAGDGRVRVSAPHRSGPLCAAVQLCYRCVPLCVHADELWKVEVWCSSAPLARDYRELLRGRAVGSGTLLEHNLGSP